MKYYEVKFNILAHNDNLQDVRDVLMALAGEAGFETFEETADGGVVGYIQQQLFSDDLLQSQLGMLPYADAEIGYSVREAEDRDWNEQWEQEGFQPIIVADRLVVHDGRHLPEHEAPTMIEIDARLAFGTGNHETTRMMIAHLLSLDLRGRRMLDCGTGTGILAIAALKLGASEAIGYDIDDWSVDNARHNAVINRVDDRFRALPGDATEVIPTLSGAFDVVAANINRNILLADMPLMASRLAADGRLLLSGFYRDDLPALLSRADAVGLMLLSAKNEGEWQSCMLGKK